MMYLGAPAWMLMTIAAASKLIEGDAGGIDIAMGIAMFFIMFAVSLVPKVVGMIDIMLRKGGTRAYGGTGRFLAGAFVETVFSILLAPVVAFRVTLFLGGLLFGKKVMWSGQNRDAYKLTWGDALRGLWPQTLFGLGLAAAMIGVGPDGVVWWGAPMIAGLALSIPFAVLTANPGFGAWAERMRLCGVPEEWDGPRELTAAREDAAAALLNPKAQPGLLPPQAA